jgi:hypothetical protein
MRYAAESACNALERADRSMADASVMASVVDLPAVTVRN